MIAIDYRFTSMACLSAHRVYIYGAGYAEAL